METIARKPFPLDPGVVSIPESAILEVNRRVRSLKKAGRQVIELHVGDTNQRAPRAIVARIKRALDEGRTHYEGVASGVEAVREQIAGYHWRHDGVRYSAEDVFLSAGGMEGVMLTLFCLLRAGDEVLLPNPRWEIYDQQVRVKQAVVKEVLLDETQDWKLSPDELARHVRPQTALALFNFPSNPTGAMLTQPDLDLLLPILTRHDLPIIEDQAYRNVLYDGEYRSLAAYPELTDRVIVIGTLSKSHAVTGLRMGYVLTRDHGLRRQLEKLGRIFRTNLPPVLQYGMLPAFQENPRMEAERARYLASLKRRVDYVVDRCQRMGLRCVPPRGGIYVFPNVQRDSRRFADYLLERYAVSAVAGSYFGSAGRHNVRLSPSMQNLATLEEAMDRFEQALASYRE